MSTDTIAIKPNNHRVYQCPTEKKVELVNKIISQNSGAKIVVACSSDVVELKKKIENKEITVLEDRELVINKTLEYEILISFDMPIKAIVYMARISKATQKAYLLLDQSEQKELYAIEMLLGRAIKQEVIEGFEYPVVIKDRSDKPAYKTMSKVEIKDEAKKRYEANTQDAPQKVYDKPKKDFKPNADRKWPKKESKPNSDGKWPKKDAKSGGDDKWAKKKKAPNKFLGKDESGKAMFSGKDGERNHRHDGTPRGNYDAPKAGGRKISIKAIKPKESKES